MVFLTTILLYHVSTIPSLIIYSPEKTDIPPLLIFLYNSIQSRYIQSVNLFVDNTLVLKIFKHSETARSIMLVFSNSVFLFIPMIIYKKNTVKYYTARGKKAKNITMSEKLLFIIILITILLNGVIISTFYSTRQVMSQFPPLGLKYIIFWLRYIFISCILGPISEELLFRGILLDEIKECYKLPPCLAILYQAIVFFVLHIIISGKYAPYLFLIGIITGVLYFYTSSLVYGLVFHICNNIIAFVLSTGIIDIDGIKMSYFVVFCINIILFCLTFLCFSLFIKRMKRKLVSLECPKALCNTTNKPE
jgi:membrane protease YdiL (CAAX protease family)